MKRQTAAKPAAGSARAIGCPDCGASLSIKRQAHRYTLHPRWAITIADAEVRRCPKCGYFEVAIPRPDALHRTVAAAVIRKAERLSGPEMAFLRQELGLTGHALARTLGVVKESVSRWENDAQPIPPPIDRLLRTTVALAIDGEKFPVELLAQIEGEAAPLKLVVEVDERGVWKRSIVMGTLRGFPNPPGANS